MMHIGLRLRKYKLFKGAYTICSETEDKAFKTAIWKKHNVTSFYLVIFSNYYSFFSSFRPFHLFYRFVLVYRVGGSYPPPLQYAPWSTWSSLGSLQNQPAYFTLSLFLRYTPPPLKNYVFKRFFNNFCPSF